MPVVFAHLRTVRLSVTAAVLGLSLAGGRAGADPGPTAPTQESVRDAGRRLGNAAIADASRRRLARTLTMYAARSIRKDELSLADIELATILSESAVTLDPDSETAWRIRQGIATIGAGSDPQLLAIRREATARLARLAPDDEVVRLQRIVDAIERKSTAEERIAGYRAMLTKESVARIGKPVAARLAVDLALLLQRTGDMAGMREALVEAVNLDPAFPAATAMAAGYFRNVASPVEEAELLAMAMVANPTDQLLIRAFAQILLEHGAYRGASRFLTIAAGVVHAPRPSEIYDPLLADLCIALWADGRGEQATELLKKRKRELDLFLKETVVRQDPAMMTDPDRLAGIEYPPLAVQAVVRTAIVRERDDPAELEAALRGAASSFDAAAEPRGREGREGFDSDLQQLHLDAAFFWVSLGGDNERARRHFRDAGAKLEIPEADRTRIEGWLALRDGDPAAAIGVLAGRAESDPLALLGYGFALEGVGRRREAAEAYRKLFEAGSSTVAGIIAGKRLAFLLGAAIPASPEAAALEAIADSISAEFDSLFDDKRSPVTLRTRVPEPLPDAFEPIPVTFELTNASRFPLAISPSGPIRPVLAIQCAVATAGRNRVAELPYQMLGMDRKLVVPARSTYRVTIDLSSTEIGEAISTFCATGSSSTMRCLVNWLPTMGGLRAGMLGDREDAPQLRADGVKINADWVRESLERIRDPKTPEDLVTVARLAAAGYLAVDPQTRLDPDSIAALDEFWPVLAEIMPRLDPYSQAWLIAVMPNTIERMRPAFDAVADSADPTVRLAYLIRRSDRSSDAVVEAALASTDPTIARYGRVVQLMLEREEEILRRDYNLAPSP